MPATDLLFAHHRANAPDPGPATGRRLADSTDSPGGLAVSPGSLGRWWGPGEPAGRDVRRAGDQVTFLTLSFNGRLETRRTRRGAGPPARLSGPPLPRSRQ
jgi:hypothetical protein